MQNKFYNYNAQTGEAGLEEQAASAAIFATTGVPISPQAIANISKFVDSTMDVVKEFWSWLGWGDKSNTEKVPGGVVWFWKYVAGGPNFGQPIVNEDCSKSYYVQYQKDLAKDGDIPEATPKGYAEMEQIFNAYYPSYVEGINKGTIKRGEPMLKLMQTWEATRLKAIADAKSNTATGGGIKMAGVNFKYVVGGAVALILLGIFFSSKKA
jgi:hypothetical protein